MSQRCLGYDKNFYGAIDAVGSLLIQGIKVPHLLRNYARELLKLGALGKINLKVRSTWKWEEANDLQVEECTNIVAHYRSMEETSAAGNVL